MDASRRKLLLAMTGVLPVACATRAGSGALPGAGLQAARPDVRAAALGQRWEYRVRNLYNDRTVDEYAESVVAAGPQVHIRRSTQGLVAQADEVHAPWGMLQCDPYWDPTIAFARPLPAWPPELASTDVQNYERHYHTLGSPDFPLWWSQQMRPVAWERITVPAGTFVVLRFENFIGFDSSEPWRVECSRAETVWLCPQVGRWVRRRRQGIYYNPGRSGGEMYEDYRQWDLLAWQ